MEESVRLGATLALEQLELEEVELLASIERLDGRLSELGSRARGRTL